MPAYKSQCQIVFMGVVMAIIVVASGCVAPTAQRLSDVTPSLTTVTPIEPTITIIPIITPEPTYPKPSYVPELRLYNIDKSHDIWHAQDPSSYITPDNEWVTYYASQLFVDTDGYVKYKNEKVIQAENFDGTLQYTYKPFINDYNFDIYKEAYGYVDENNVPWLMPDYYLTHGQRGVCSAWANTLTSLMLSGEMSVIKNSVFAKQIISAKAILGYTEHGLRDGWVEYNVYNKTFYSASGIDKGESYTIFIEKSDVVVTPAFEYSDKFFRRVNEYSR